MVATPAWNLVLRTLREVRGISQDGWAARLGYSRRTLVRWEQGVALPDAAAESAIIAACQAERLFRSYDQGPLAEHTVTAAWLAELLAAARAGRLLPESTAVHLPTPLTRFIGREQELADVTTLLRTTRLLTLTGPGGSGKTRLAIEAARQVADQFSGSAWFVDLSAVADPAFVLVALANVLDVRETGDRPVAHALASYLRARHLLLVLDNVEQVAEAAPALYDLLAGAPQLCLLVTSRVRLRIEGEREYPVAPLPLPDATAQPEQLRANPAVQLLVERARALRPDFQLTPENAASIAAICRRLDGLPLAIELAAARVKLFPPAQLLARLDQRLPFLIGGERNRPPRQQTLRNTIQWSWDLLTQAEQVLIRRLSVFSGGWTIAAAEAVCSSLDDLDVALQLESLVDKSLVRQTEQAGEMRFGLFPTLQEFAVEQLAANGETIEIRDRHADYYAAAAEATVALYWRTGRILQELLLPLDTERDNLTAALGWVVERQDAPRALRLAAALGPWFFFRSPTEGRRWAHLALALTDTEESRPARGLVSYTITRLSMQLGEPQAGLPYIETAVALFRALEDWPWLARALVISAQLVSGRNASQGEQFAHEALSIARKHCERYDVAFAEHWAGWASWQAGKLGAAQTHFEAALQLARELEADFLIMQVLGGLAMLAQQLEDAEEMRHLYRQVLPLAEGLGEHYWLALACIQLACGGPDASESSVGTLWTRGLLAAHALGNAAFIAICLAGVASVLATNGLAEDAVRLLAASSHHWREEEARTDWRALFDAVFQSAVAATSAILNAGAFAQAWAAGDRLSLEQAAELALTTPVTLLPGTAA